VEYLRAHLRLFAREQVATIVIDPSLLSETSTRLRYERWLGFSYADCGYLPGAIALLTTGFGLWWFEPFSLFPFWPNSAIAIGLCVLGNLAGKLLGLAASYGLAVALLAHPARRLAPLNGDHSTGGGTQIELEETRGNAS
jgi:hypothetical protein